MPFILQIIDVFILPIVLGLISVTELHTSTYGQVIHRMDSLKPHQKLIQSLLFVIIKSLSLAVLGIFFGLLGERFFGSSFGRDILPFENAQFLFLGVFYMVMGLIGIMYLHTKSAFPVMHMITEEHRERLPLGISYGLVMPTGSLPIGIALIGQAFAANSAVIGMVSLCVYGIGIALPALLFMYSKKCHHLSLKYLSVHHPYMGVIVVLLLGFYEMVKSFMY